MLLGGAVGWDRERKDVAAGLRTHMMVSLGSAAFLIAGLLLSRGLDDGSGGANVQIDPTRLVAGLVTGIGFLGAGTIIRVQGDVKGLTTAAGIWTTASIGLSCGAGLYTLALLITGMCVFVLVVMRQVARLPGVRPRSGGDGDD